MRCGPWGHKEPDTAEQLSTNKQKPVQLASPTSSVCKGTREDGEKNLHLVASTKCGASSWKQTPGPSSKLVHSIHRGCSPGNSDIQPRSEGQSSG